MSQPPPPRFTELEIDELTIDDEDSVRHVALHAELKEVLRRAHYRFRVLPPGHAARWDRALLLNLAYWGTDGGGDVLVDEHLAADVVAHAAWHHLAARALSGPAGERPSADALFMGEAIASAHDIYLVGRLLGLAPGSSFLETQVPAMAEVAEAAGLSADAFEELLQDVAADPERAFEDLRALLFEATSALFASGTAEEAFAALARLDGHRFACLLHRFELSVWVLYARAYGRPEPDARVRELDRTLREAPVSLDWLAESWVRTALG